MDLNLSKLHSAIMRWTGDSDCAWDLLADAYCHLDTSRDVAEQAAFILKTAHGLYLNSFKTREVTSTALNHAKHVSYDDENRCNDVLDELTARYDEQSEAHLISELASKFDKTYRVELVVYLSFVLFNRTHESSCEFSVEAVRRVLKTAGITKASAAANAITKYLLDCVR